jgi:ankyrin repeat protein
MGCNQKISKSIKKELISNSTLDLFNAIDSNDIEKLEKLLTTENVNSFDSMGRSLMSKAIKTKDIKYIELLLKNGANPNLQNEATYMNSPLMDCSNYNLVNVAKLLIENGADVDIQDKNGDPVIHWTAYYGQVGFTKLLLDNNANAKMSSIHSDKGALQVALKEYRDSVVDLLLQYNISIFDVDEQNLKIIEAVRNNDLRFIKQNISSSNVDVQDQTAATLLIIAAQKGYFDIVQYLVKKGANLNYMNSVGQTALHLSVYFGHKKITEFLIKKGADVNKLMIDSS